MYQRRPPKYRYICYSCVTGQPVWVYQGQSREGMYKAYRRAAKKEQTRARWFQRVIDCRTQRIQRLLDECLAALPKSSGELTKEQRAAVSRLKAIIAERQERYSAFYYHIQNARRRRDKKSRRWHSKKRREMET